MLKIFTGEDRTRASREISRFLGNNYEVIEGADLNLDDLPTLFLGNSLFSETRSILIRDLGANKAAFEKLPDYLNTSHKVALLELKLDKRSSTYKSLKDKVEIKEFALPKDPNLNLIFDIYKTAKRDGQKSAIMLEKIKSNQDPIMFFGLLASGALKDFTARQGIKEKRILHELSNLDLQMKSTSIDPWLLIESFLLRLSTI